MLVLYVSAKPRIHTVASILFWRMGCNLMFWQSRGLGLVKFRHKNHSVKVRKTSCFGFKYLVLHCHKHGWKTSWCLVKNLLSLVQTELEKVLMVTEITCFTFLGWTLNLKVVLSSGKLLFCHAVSILSSSGTKKSARACNINYVALVCIAKTLIPFVWSVWFAEIHNANLFIRRLEGRKDNKFKCWHGNLQSASFKMLSIWIRSNALHSASVNILRIKAEPHGFSKETGSCWITLWLLWCI